MPQELPEEGRPVPEPHEMTRDFLDKRLSNGTKGEDFARQWYNFLRETGIGEKDLPTVKELTDIAALMDDYVQERNLTRAFDLAFPLITGVISMGLVALGAWLTSAEWHVWLGALCAGISFIVTFAFAENMAEFSRQGKENLKSSLEMQRHKIVEAMAKACARERKGE